MLQKCFIIYLSATESSKTLLGAVLDVQHQPSQLHSPPFSAMLSMPEHCTHPDCIIWAFSPFTSAWGQVARDRRRARSGVYTINLSVLGCSCRWPSSSSQGSLLVTSHSQLQLSLPLEGFLPLIVPSGPKALMTFQCFWVLQHVSLYLCTSLSDYTLL